MSEQEATTGGSGGGSGGGSFSKAEDCLVPPLMVLCLFSTFSVHG